LVRGEQRRRKTPRRAGRAFATAGAYRQHLSMKTRRRRDCAVRVTAGVYFSAGAWRMLRRLMRAGIPRCAFAYTQLLLLAGVLLKNDLGGRFTVSAIVLAPLFLRMFVCISWMISPSCKVCCYTATSTSRRQLDEFASEQPMVRTTSADSVWRGWRHRERRAAQTVAFLRLRTGVRQTADAGRG